MIEASQASRQLELLTPLGRDVLLLQRMKGTERLGRPFEYHLEALSTDANIDFARVLGEEASVRLSLATVEDDRFFHGLVSDFSQGAGPDQRYVSYRLTLRPWLWFLSRTSDCRVFQKKTVPEIVIEVFKAHGYSDFENRTTQSYRRREYCVQYRETDLDFVSRLLEEEGIYYFFEHQRDGHTLILADDAHAHDSIGSIPFCPEVDHRIDQKECIFGWRMRQRLQPTMCVLNDYDDEVPKKSLLTSNAQDRSSKGLTYEVYDYPGGYKESGEGEQYSRRRVEEMQARFELVDGWSNARALYSGVLFNLSDHPRSDQNRNLLVTDIDYEMTSDGFESGSAIAGDVFKCRLTILDAKQPFRPERITPRPVVRGPQTAEVTGPKAEEIHTDRFGRVKCQFHWDRYGKKDENSSCWVRVSQPWAGKQWGAIAFPRIGQEVIVDFLEGDPDRPIITGRVYNGEQMPPYDAEKKNTQMGIKSRSVGGAGFNELRFEDKSGKEQVFLHAERDRDTRVKNDAFEWVGGDRHLIVGKRQLELVEGEKHLTVKSGQFERVGGDKHQEAGGNLNQKVGGAFSLDTGGDIQEKTGGNHATDAATGIHLKAGMTVVVEAGTQLTLKVGGNFIVIDASGVTIQGTMVKINSGGAAGSGSGSAPTGPTGPEEPTEAVDDQADRS